MKTNEDDNLYGTMEKVSEQSSARRRIAAFMDNKSRGERAPKKKNSFFDERSRNVYENKQKHDNMPDEKSKFTAKLKPILAEIADLEGQFTLQMRFRNLF